MHKELLSATPNPKVRILLAGGEKRGIRRKRKSCCVSQVAEQLKRDLVDINGLGGGPTAPIATVSPAVFANNQFNGPVTSGNNFVDQAPLASAFLQQQQQGVYAVRRRARRKCSALGPRPLRLVRCPAPVAADLL